jgi:phosphatidylserine decarboxylase
MVPDGYYYGLPLVGAGILVAWLTSPLWAVPAFLLAAFFLWFFRDPERRIPDTPGTIVSPADGAVTAVSPVTVDGLHRTRISIFLNVFNVHVNRSPISGTIRDIHYQRGKFMNAMNAVSADKNEHNTVTVEGEGQTVVFKQIAGLLARRIVFDKKVGDRVQRGQRVGLIKFGSRVDVVLDASARVQIKIGDHVKGGSSVLAYLPVNADQPVTAGGTTKRQGER